MESAQKDPSESTPQPASGPEPTRLPAIARYWWLTALRGLVALTLALAIALAGRSTARLVTFLALYWMTGGLITLRLGFAIRPRRGARLGLVAGAAAVMGAVLVLLRDQLSGLVHPDLLISLLGAAAVLTGLLRLLGGFAAERRFGRWWTLGGIVLGALEVALGVVLLLAALVDPGLARAGRRRLGAGQRQPAGRRGDTAAPLRTDPGKQLRRSPRATVRSAVISHSTGPETVLQPTRGKVAEYMADGVVTDLLADARMHHDLGSGHVASHLL